MSMKRFIPSIYLYQGAAITGLFDLTLINADPVKLAHFYSENGADELLVFDMSQSDDERKEHLAIIKEICERVSAPLIGAGNIARMDDIKDLIYAGCRKAVLNFAKDANIALTAEAAAKFGKEKIVASVGKRAEMTANEAVLGEYVSEVLVINEHFIRGAAEISSLPLILHIPKITLDKIIELLTVPVNAAITGNAINDNAKELLKIKDLCRENGIILNEFIPALSFSELHKTPEGLVPVIVQEVGTNEVLMMAYMNEEAFNKTMKSGRMTYYSRSRSELWVKGETSGHYQYLRALTTDCDKDTLLARVTQVGAACHLGTHSCFTSHIIDLKLVDEKNPATILMTVMGVIGDRKANPKEGSYTNYLFDKGLDKILKKLGEESTEIVIAAKNPNPHEIKYEIVDYLYHLMVLMAEKEISWDEIMAEMAKR